MLAEPDRDDEAVVKASSSVICGQGGAIRAANGCPSLVRALGRRSPRREGEGGEDPGGEHEASGHAESNMQACLESSVSRLHDLADQ